VDMDDSDWYSAEVYVCDTNTATNIVPL
jgi:hypothetical protein